MTEKNAPGQLPPDIGVGYRKITKSAVEVTKSEREERETREIGAGRIEKQVVTSEFREAKTSLHEVFEPAPRIASLPSNWQAHLPDKVRIRITGVQSAGCADASDFDGEYILDLIDVGPGQCRWELTLPAKCHLYRICLIASQGSDGSITLVTGFEGSEAAPSWRGTAVGAFVGASELFLDRPFSANPCAGCQWPDAVTAEPVPKLRAYISPEPTTDEVLLMQASSSSYCSTDRCHICGASLVTTGKVIDQDTVFDLPAGQVGPNVSGAMRWRTNTANNISKVGGRPDYYKDQDGNAFPAAGGYFQQYKAYIWTEAGTGRWVYMRGFVITFDYCDGETHPCVWDVLETGTIYEWDPTTMKFVENVDATKATYPNHPVDQTKPSTQPKDITKIPVGSDSISTGKLKQKRSGCGRRFVFVDFPSIYGTAGQGWGQDVVQTFTITDQDGQIAKYLHHFGMYREPNQTKPTFTSSGLKRLQ